MKPKTFFVTGLLAAFAMFSIGVIAADNPVDAPVDIKAEPAKAKKLAEAKMKVKRHSHMEEKTGIPQKAPEVMADKPNPANDKTKHFHPRDGK